MKRSLVLALLATAGTVCAQNPPGPLVRSFPFAPANGGIPVGLEENGGGELLYTAIGTIDELGAASVAGVIRLALNISASNANPIGCSIAGNRVWVTDTAAAEVDIFDNFGVYLSSFSVSAQSTFPEGITYRATNGHLYMVDGAGGNKVSEYDPLGTHITDYPILGSSPDGIAWDPATDTFWIYDSGSDCCRNYSTSFSQLRNFSGPRSNGFASGEGVAIIGTELFVCSTGSDVVCVYDLTALNYPAANIPYGAGCPVPPTFYEQFTAASPFDLSVRAIRMTPNAVGGYDVTPSATPFNTNFANNLNSGDDQLFAALPLGFPLPTPFGVVNAIDVDSNGRCGWGLPRSDFTETVAEFIATPMIAALWDDLNPAAGGALYFDQLPGRTIITWWQIPEFGTSNQNTVQVQLYPSGNVVIVWDVCALLDSIVGVSGDFGYDPGNRDISATLPFFTYGAAPMGLSANALPVIGTSATFTMSNIPPGTAGAGLMMGFLPNAVPLDAIGMTGCTDLIDLDLVFSGIALPSGTASVAYPNNHALLGASVYWQGFVLNPFVNPYGLALSSGLETRLGDH